MNDRQKLERLRRILEIAQDQLKELRVVELEWREFRPNTPAGALDNLQTIIDEKLAELGVER